MFNTQNVRQLGMQLMDWFQWSFLTGEAWVFNIIMGILIGFPQKSITRLSLTTTTIPKASGTAHIMTNCHATKQHLELVRPHSHLCQHIEAWNCRSHNFPSFPIRGCRKAVSLSWPSSAGVLHCQHIQGVGLAFLELVRSKETILGFQNLHP